MAGAYLLLGSGLSGQWARFPLYSEPGSSSSYPIHLIKCPGSGVRQLLGWVPAKDKQSAKSADSAKRFVALRLIRHAKITRLPRLRIELRTLGLWDLRDYQLRHHGMHKGLIRGFMKAAIQTSCCCCSCLCFFQSCRNSSPTPMAGVPAGDSHAHCSELSSAHSAAWTKCAEGSSRCHWPSWQYYQGLYTRSTFYSIGK